MRARFHGHRHRAASAACFLLIATACGGGETSVSEPGFSAPSTTAGAGGGATGGASGSPAAAATLSLAERAARVGPGGFTFAVVGDFYSDDPDDGAYVEDAIETRDDIIASGADFVIGLGDYDYADSTVEGFLEMIAPLEEQAVIFPAFGNHDGISEGEISAPRKYAALRDHFQVDEFYSFDVGPLHFISINSEYPEGSEHFAEQLEFVQRDLDAAFTDPTVRWIIPYFHRAMVNPLSTSGPDPTLHNVLYPIVDGYQEKIPIAFQAHHHIYVRTHAVRYSDRPDLVMCPDDSATSSCVRLPTIADDGGTGEVQTYSGAAGIIFATVGTGGAFATGRTPDSDYIVIRHKPVSITDEDDPDANTFGFLAITLDDDLETLTAEFRANNGEVLDRFVITP